MKWNRQRSCRAICLSVAWGALIARAGALETTMDSSVLELSIAVRAGTFALYEPVVVEYTVTNPTDKVIEAMIFLESSNDIDFSISQNGQPGQPFRFEVSDCSTHSEPNRFAPHESQSRCISMFYNHQTRTLAFPAPGSYTIEERLDVSSFERGYETVKARPIVIQVVEPGGRDREAMEFLGSERDLIRLQRYGAAQYCKEPGSRSACVQRLLTFLDRYAASSYAPAVAYHLAMAKAAGSNPQGITRDLPNSGDLLDMFFKAWATHPLAADVMALLAGDLARSGHTGDAKRWVDRFREDYPNRKDQFERLESLLSPEATSE